MQDPNHHHHDETTPSPKCNTARPKRPIFKGLPGKIAFRFVYHTSTIDGLIESSDSIVSQLRRDIGFKIHCEDSVAATEDRVILIMGSFSLRRPLELADGHVDFSNVQEAVVRVFERVWELEAEKANRAVKSGEVFSKLLAHTSQIAMA